MTDRLRERFGKASTGLAFSDCTDMDGPPSTDSSVTYLIQRSEAMAGLFYLLTLTVSFVVCPVNTKQDGTRRLLASCAGGNGEQTRYGHRSDHGSDLSV